MFAPEQLFGYKANIYRILCDQNNCSDAKSNFESYKSILKSECKNTTISLYNKIKNPL